MTLFDFKFDLPVSGWQDQTIYSFKGPNVDDLDHFIMIAIDRDLQQTSLPDYAKERTHLITSSLENIDILKQGPVGLPGGMQVEELFLKWSISPQIIRYKRYLFLIHNNMGFTLNCDFSKDSYNQLNDQFTKIAAALFHTPQSSPPPSMGW